MSVFTSRITQRLQVPHDPDQAVTIRKLAPRHLDAAAVESYRQSLERTNLMGGMSAIQTIRALTAETPKAEADGAAAAVAAATPAADPLSGYDRATLVAKSLVDWTYDAPTTMESVLDLDEETLDFLAREVLRLSLPKLFLTDAQQEAARKNG